MDFSKKALRTLLIYLALLIAAGALSLYNVNRQLVFPHGLIRSFLENAIFLHWLFSARRRFPQKQMRLHVTLFVASFMVLNFLMTAKYCFTQQDSVAQRYLWYAYYTTFVFGPLFMFHASLYFGKPDDHVVSGRWNWMYLPPALISVGVLTNDWHQLAFHFNSGFAHWNDDYLLSGSALDACHAAGCDRACRQIHAQPPPVQNGVAAVGGTGGGGAVSYQIQLFTGKRFMVDADNV